MLILWLLLLDYLHLQLLIKGLDHFINLKKMKIMLQNIPERTGLSSPFHKNGS